MKVTMDDQLRRCADNRSVWLDLVTSHDVTNRQSTSSNLVPQPSSPRLDSFQHVSKSSPVELQQIPQISPPGNGPMPTLTFRCVADSLIWLSQGRDSRLLNGDDSQLLINGLPECMKSADLVQVLCTGSLHLVGDILSLIDPFICDK